MAVDTRNKRASILGIGLAAALVLPAPDATVAQSDRQQTAFAYAGISAESPTEADPLVITVPAEDHVITVPSGDQIIYVRAKP